MKSYDNTMYSQLESYVDTHGLEAVMSALADICAEKACHIRENWQDKALARMWDKAGTVVAKAADKIDLPPHRQDGPRRTGEHHEQA